MQNTTDDNAASGSLDRLVSCDSETVRPQPLYYEDWTRHYYGVDFYCDNCGKHNHRLVRMGVRSKGLTTKCDNCGCDVVRS
jgi:predicted RNA-binding Zn-ribbon protein involved in translation (DUF1610 family)